MTKQIAIDGPAGAGKSTIARLVADRLGFVYIDTGAMYRAVALYLLKKGVDPADEASSGEAAQNAKITLQSVKGAQRIFLNEADVSDAIRTQDVGAAASLASRYKAIRSKLTSLQRETADACDVVMDGRDIGTTVLPDAQLKIFLTADPAVRAKRRYDQLAAKGETGLDLGAIEREIRTRDRQDTEREESPLRCADDAIRIDSSDLSIAEVCEKILTAYRTTVR
jgi:cytidylate kinase